MRRHQASVCSIALFSVCSLRRVKFPIIYPDLRLDCKVATHPYPYLRMFKMRDFRLQLVLNSI